MRCNTTGARNTAVGLSALINNVGGAENVSIGVNAMYSNAGGYGNVGIGYRALVFANANRNIAIGQNALASTTTAHIVTGKQIGRAHV